MRVSFKVSKRGSRFHPKPKLDTPTAPEDEDVDAPTQISKNQSTIATPKPSVDVTENGEDAAEILDADVSFLINLFADGYSIGNPSENRIGHQAVQDDPKFLHPYDRTSESLFLAIERGLLPADFLDDIPLKYTNGAVACEVRDYRNCGSDADASPKTTKIRLKMSLENVVKDIPLISDSSWTYGDLMEVEARILIALQPKLDLNPTPNLDRLCKPPTSTNLNLNIRELRRKRLRLLSGSENPVNGKKICIDRVPENSNSGLMVQPSDAMNLTAQNAGVNNMVNDMVNSVPASPSLSYQSKYQIGAGNPRHLMQDHNQEMMNSYGDNMNNMNSNMAKRENQDNGQLSPMASLTKRARSNSNPIGLESQQQIEGFNSLIQQQQSIGRGIQKYPFEGGFSQDPFTMGQPGMSMRYNLKQEPVENELNRNIHMVDQNIDPILQQQQQQRLSQQFTRSNFPPTPWNNLEASRKGKPAQSPRVSSGTLPQSPLSSKSGEFSSGSHGAQYGVAAQRDKSAVTSVATVGGQTLTSNAQIAAARRSNSLPKTPAMSGVGSPASASNMTSGPYNAASPLVGKEADKSMRDRFSKIEILTVRYQLNCKKNKVDEYRKTTTFPTQQLNHYLYNDHNTEIPKDDTCKMPLSKSLVGGSMNVCKTRVLNFLQTERVLQGTGYSLMPKSRTRMILSEKRDDGTVAMHYGELDDCDYLAAEECLPTLPNTHVADLLAAQFCTLILREGYHVEGDHLQPKPTTTVRSSSEQPNNNNNNIINNNVSGVSPEIPESVSGQPSNEVPKPSDNLPNNNNINNNINVSSARMHPPTNSQPLQIPQNSLLPASRESQQPSFQHNVMQQQLQRSFASNPLSHLNTMGQNSNMQQLGHMLNKASPLELQILRQQQQQQQQQQQPQLQRKMMMGLGGNTGNNNNNMVGLQGVMGGVRGISPGAISGINMNQGSNIGNVISQQLRSGMITHAHAALLSRMAQNRNMLTGGQSGNLTNRQVHPGASNYSMLGPTMNRGNNMNPMQRTAMAPPKLVSNMNVYMNNQQQMPHQQQQMPHQQQQQETTSPLQAVLSPPQQVGSPSMGLPPQQQQASPQQMSQRTPMSPQLSSGAVHQPMGADGAGPASPQLSSQTMGSVSSMANSPMEMQGVNKSS